MLPHNSRSLPYKTINGFQPASNNYSTPSNPNPLNFKPHMPNLKLNKHAYNVYRKWTESTGDFTQAQKVPLSFKLKHQFHTTIFLITGVMRPHNSRSLPYKTLRTRDSPWRTDSSQLRSWHATRTPGASASTRSGVHPWSRVAASGCACRPALSRPWLRSSVRVQAPETTEKFVDLLT